MYYLYMKNIKILAKIAYQDKDQLIIRNIKSKEDLQTILDNSDLDTKDKKVIIIFNNNLLSFKIKQAI